MSKINEIKVGPSRSNFKFELPIDANMQVAFKSIWGGASTIKIGEGNFEAVGPSSNKGLHMFFDSRGGVKAMIVNR